jgi:transposase-like protein
MKRNDGLCIFVTDLFASIILIKHTKSQYKILHRQIKINAMPKLCIRLAASNTIESFNCGIRKYTKTKTVFPDNPSALKAVYLAISNAEQKGG